MLAVRVKGSEVFRSELVEARRLGYQLQVALNEKTSVASARLVPQTGGARAAVAAASSESGQIIQANYPFLPGESGDVLRECIRSVLARAKEIA